MIARPSPNISLVETGNLDQHLATTAIQDVVPVSLLRSGTLTRAALADALGRLVSEPAYAQAAGQLRDEFARWNAPAVFSVFVDGNIWFGVNEPEQVSALGRVSLSEPPADVPPRTVMHSCTRWRPSPAEARRAFGLLSEPQVGS